MKLFNWFKKPKKFRFVRRAFDAATSSRFFSSWTTSAQTPDQIIYAELGPLRARSRNLARKSSYAKRYISLSRSHVLGHQGIRLNVKATLPGGAQDTQANNAIEAAWRRWGRFADYSGRMHFNQIMQLVLRHLIVDGEAFIEIVDGARAGPFNFQLRLIDPALIDLNDNRSLSNGNYTRFGIEYTSRGVPAAYWVAESNSISLHGGSYTAISSARKVRIPAADVLHLFMPDMVGQRRGLPWLETALGEIKMIDGYLEAAVVNAREGASKMGFIMMPGNQLMTGADGQVGDKLMDSEAGEWRQLPAGSEVHTYNPSYPDGEMDTFLKAGLRSVASGLNISYNSLANDLEQVNFSSMRHGAVEDRDNWKILQEFLVDACYDLLYKRWLNVQIVFGNIDGLVETRINEYMRSAWLARRWAWIDPLSEAKAIDILLKNKIVSRYEVIRERGRDPEAVDAEIEADDYFPENEGSNNAEQNDDGDEGRQSPIPLEPDRKAAV